MQKDSSTKCKKKIKQYFEAEKSACHYKRARRDIVYIVSSLYVHQESSQYWHGMKSVAVHDVDVPYMEDTRNYSHQLVPPREPPSNFCNHTIIMILTNGSDPTTYNNCQGSLQARIQNIP
jgi:hypothetical protein